MNPDNDASIIIQTKFKGSRYYNLTLIIEMRMSGQHCQCTAGVEPLRP